MSGFWVMVSAAWLLATAAAILVGGLVSGGWLGGSLWSAAAIVALADWLRLRKSTESAQVVADRLIFTTMFVLLGLALPALHHIEAWLGR